MTVVRKGFDGYSGMQNGPEKLHCLNKLLFGTHWKSQRRMHTASNVDGTRTSSVLITNCRTFLPILKNSATVNACLESAKSERTALVKVLMVSVFN